MDTAVNDLQLSSVSLGTYLPVDLRMRTLNPDDLARGFQMPGGDPCCNRTP